MKVEVVYHRFLGSQNSNFPIFSEYNLKCILRCCTEPFFRIFDFGVTFFEPKKYEIKKTRTYGSQSATCLLGDIFYWLDALII